ncbi:MAG: histidine kinase [Nannocystaceae bacterium]
MSEAGGTEARGAAAPERVDDLLVDTLRALGAPRRLIPILLVSIPLVAAQHSLSRDPLAMPLGVLMCLCFAFGAPYLWRRYMPEGTWRKGLVRVATYGLVGAVIVGVLGVLIPRLLGVGATFLTGRESLTVSLALFWVGGWGLGRDIELERRLERERARAEALAREAERAQLLALRAHLDPHFLFNTLNAIAEWCREDGAVAEAAVLRLSSMLRTILAGVHLAAWPLARELELCRDLFELHKIRDPDRFLAEVVAPEAASIERAEVPPMILLPLAENAIKHGPAAGHPGPVVLTVTIDDARITATIENPGRYAGPRPGGEGLPTIDKRLALAYDGAASWTIRAVDGRTVATVTMPRRGPALAV